MKGDLHTLQKVCLYGSKVMLAGIWILGGITAVLIAMGIEVLATDGSHQMFQDVLSVDLANDSVLKCASAFAEIVIIFILAMVTVVCIRTLMVSIYSEHSPFTDDNVRVLLFISRLYLVIAFVFAALEMTGERGIASAAFMLFGCILISTVLYILALVVRYGAVLQNESDHTL